MKIDQKFNITNRRYTGSKTKLNTWIETHLNNHCKDCNSLADIFAGTASVTAHNIHNYDDVYLNDLLYSNEIIYKAFFKKGRYKKSLLDEFKSKYQEINPKTLPSNYFSKNFSGKFFGKDDAKIIGYIREDIKKNGKILTNKEECLLLASLIYSADRAANTVGHYDAYRKIEVVENKFKYRLIEPINHNSSVQIYREDANMLVRRIKPDICYIDPPYNSRQYSRFYHVLENLAQWKKPKLYGVALKPEPENMSDYCRNSAYEQFQDLIKNIDAKRIVVSYNNTYKSKSSSSRNKISLEQIVDVLNSKGKTLEYSISHAHFNAGKTNFADHKEFLFITKVTS